MEQWKQFRNTRYEVSSMGNVRSVWNDNNKHMILQMHPKGYLRIKLGSEKFFVHRLVAECFIKPIKGKTHVNHKDLNKENNNIENLEWCNCYENNQHAQDNGVGTIARPCIVFTKKGELFGEFNSYMKFRKIRNNRRDLIMIYKDEFTQEKLQELINKPRKKCGRYIPSTKRKLSNEQVLEIRELFKSPENYDWKIAHMYGLNNTIITSIRLGKTYRDV